MRLQIAYNFSLHGEIQDSLYKTVDADAVPPVGTDVFLDKDHGVPNLRVQSVDFWENARTQFVVNLEVETVRGESCLQDFIIYMGKRGWHGELELQLPDEERVVNLCKTCQHWEGDVAADHQIGICRLNPPMWTDDDAGWHQPSSNPDDWCSHWEASD